MPMMDMTKWTITCDGDAGLPCFEGLGDPGSGEMTDPYEDVDLWESVQSAERRWHQADGQILARTTGRAHLCGDHRIECDPDDITRYDPIKGQAPARSRPVTWPRLSAAAASSGST